MEFIPIPKPVILRGIPEDIHNDIQFNFREYGESDEDGHWLQLSLEERKRSKQRVENTILLGTTLEMPRVWKEVFKLEKQRINRTISFSTSSFRHAIEKGLYEETTWGELTPKARVAKHTQIVHTIRQLAKDIKYYDLDQSEEVLNLFNNNEGAHVRPDKKAAWPGPFASHEDIYNKQTGIGISDLLQKHADKLEHEKRYRAPLTSKTKGERRLLHFIRTLAIHNKERYGQHHGALISRVASVFFPDAETGAEKIRASIQALNL